jgi:FkbM family methyltransferase
MLKKTSFANSPFFYSSDDIHIGQRIAINKYEPYLTKLILDNIDSKSVAIDVGANIGYYTILMAKKAKKVYGFEPEKANFKILKKNIKASQLKNIEIIKAAVGNQTGTAKLNINKNNYGAHAISSKGQTVEITTLDQALKKEKRINLIKADVQGWEPEVFLGARKIIERDLPTIIFEYWPKGLKKAKKNSKKMFSFLKQYYPTIYFIDEYTQIYFPTKQQNLSQLMEKNRRDDCNLMLKKRNIFEFLHQYKDFWPKKYLKRALKTYPLT